MFNVVGILFNCDKRFSKYDKVHVSQWVNSCDQSEVSDKLYDGDFDPVRSTYCKTTNVCSNW